MLVYPKMVRKKGVFGKMFLASSIEICKHFVLYLLFGFKPNLKYIWEIGSMGHRVVTV